MTDTMHDAEDGGEEVSDTTKDVLRATGLALLVVACAGAVPAAVVWAIITLTGISLAEATAVVILAVVGLAIMAVITAIDAGL